MTFRAGSSLALLHRETSRAHSLLIDSDPPLFIDTAVGAEAFETYLQLGHGAAVARLVWVCLEIDKLCFEEVRKGKMKHVCGQQFYWVLLKRMLSQ